MVTAPTFMYETPYWQRDYYVIGADEVGKGAFAGPVVASAVVFPPFLQPTCLLGVHDSKLLTRVKREKLVTCIKEHAIASAIAVVDVTIINAIGIGKATSLAIRQAVESIMYQVASKNKKINDMQETNYILPTTQFFTLVDGYPIPTIEKEKQCGIIKGDQKSLTIAAASILAKVYRDQLMQEHDILFPAYGFRKHVGYGTKMHREAIKKNGLSPLHRRSFDLLKYL